jgi:hypothetical protein
MTIQNNKSDEDWRYILLNGRNRSLAVLNPEFEKGELISIDDLRPFEKKDDEGKDIKPNISDANNAKRLAYADFFRKPFKNLLILSGAGSSLDVGGPLMSHLWTNVDVKYKKGDTDGFKIIREKIKYTSEKKDLEALLSQIDGLIKFGSIEDIRIDSESVDLASIKETILEIIKTGCSILKPTGQYPHKIFLEKLLQRKQTSPRIKVFTLNYDLLFEYAANDVNAIIIDGFSFTYPRTFSGRLFDYDIVQREGSKVEEEDNFIQRVFHLHKLHGSLNWERKDGKILLCDKPTHPLLIYPRESKYEDSYEQPFFEMMARFQRNLRVNNDTLLISIGYSFNDKHINAAIEEALNQNPSFRLAVIDPLFDSDNAANPLKEILKIAEDSERIIMVSEKFSDFAKYFPEIKTYEGENLVPVNLKNEKPKN